MMNKELKESFALYEAAVEDYLRIRGAMMTLDTKVSENLSAAREEADEKRRELRSNLIALITKE